MDITDPHRMDLANVYMQEVTRNHANTMEALQYLSPAELERYEKYAKSCEEGIAYISDLQMHILTRAQQVSSERTQAIKELTK